jgi:hypothetical protein
MGHHGPQKERDVSAESQREEGCVECQTLISGRSRLVVFSLGYVYLLGYEKIL